VDVECQVPQIGRLRQEHSTFASNSKRVMVDAEALPNCIAPTKWTCCRQVPIQVCIFIQWPLPLHLEIQVDLHTHKVHPSIICASHSRLLRVHAASVTSPHVRERDHVGWRLCSQLACAYRLHQSCDAHKPGPAGSHFWNRFFFFALNFIEINWRTKKGSLWA
jgi:hypothetical protein